VNGFQQEVIQKNNEQSANNQRTIRGRFCDWRDAAGNITSCTVSDGTNTFVYDQNNRLTSYNGQAVTYDMDGNMLSNGYINCEFDSGNRLISAGGHTYTYNAEDVRI